MRSVTGADRTDASSAPAGCPLTGGGATAGPPSVAAIPRSFSRATKAEVTSRTGSAGAIFPSWAHWVDSPSMATGPTIPVARKAGCQPVATADPGA